MTEVSVRVIAAYAASAGRARAVYEADDGRIGLAEGRIDRSEPGRPMFEPQSLAEVRRFAEMAISGNAAALAHPKGTLVLAAALVAVMETLTKGEVS